MSPHSEEVVLTSTGAADVALHGNALTPTSNGSNRAAEAPAPALAPDAPATSDAPQPLTSTSTATLPTNGPNAEGTGASSNGASTNGNGVGTHHAKANSNGQAVQEPLGSSGREFLNGAAQSSPYLVPTALDSGFDLICVGFGPASLSVAIAMHDAIAAGRKLLPDGSYPKVLFIEKQNHFAWHSGMLLPGAKMQISFIKDLATLRDPRSEFTFLNYLHRQDRLVDFTNLSTFLPARVEYEDYLRWCSSFFTRLVRFGQQVVSVSPNNNSKGPVRSFTVQSQDTATGQAHTYRGRHVLVAAGGQPSMPKNFPLKHPRVIHSSQYANVIGELIPKTATPCRVVVVGAGQSAAEIFNNVASRFPNSKTYLVMRPEFLRPSDDSPFVNTVFNPEFVGSLYTKSAKYRNNFLIEARATNYGVVRLELIEALYERMYDQRRELGADEKAWPHRIMGGKQIISIEPHGETLELKVQSVQDGALDGFIDDADVEVIEADLVIAATGYQRNAHVGMLKDAWNMLPKAAPGGLQFSKGITGWNVETEQGERKIAVGRDYKVKFAPGTVADEAGVWLQGCCEGTHGLSDTLLSVLATRSGEIVDSIFGSQ
ncbi:L-ornithine 5-monooxygenase (L-ornithine N(5)-oxygenase) [Metarhizium guizhouense ARSEF 977]|uniref:L-ornithine N(5)-monooxygenase [NAD(P)H] n=1 Tax=Metarhizium guizhouense (strain ARSEF 977) TaxID=1276136 RepID=A0A0B4GMP1_METGA|nr:L-ornithine 5-monooxygenase (L-ornithine N(5)-oxygenase) [Metarhizium guizhouense ARSEF 977]